LAQSWAPIHELSLRVTPSGPSFVAQPWDPIHELSPRVRLNACSAERAFGVAFGVCGVVFGVFGVVFTLWQGPCVCVRTVGI
jgi:hypothetical protein